MSISETQLRSMYACFSDRTCCVVCDSRNIAQEARVAVLSAKARACVVPAMLSFARASEINRNVWASLQLLA